MRCVVLLLAFILAGCVHPITQTSEPIGTNPTGSSGPTASTTVAQPIHSPSGPQPVGDCVQRVPDPHDGLRAVLNVEPLTVHPGDAQVVCAAVYNDGPQAFAFPSCTGYLWGPLDDHGQAWSYQGVDAAQNNLSNCPSDGSANVLSGSHEIMRHVLRIPDSAMAGNMTVRVDFHGLQASTVINISTGSGSGQPVLVISATTWSAAAGQTVAFQANLTNPTMRYFRYWTGCQINVITFNVLDASNQTVASNPASTCMGADYETTLPPGFNGTTTWNWTIPSQQASGDYRLRVGFVYTDDSANRQELAVTKQFMVT